MNAIVAMLKGHGNETLDSARVLYVLSWLVLVGLQFIALFVKEQPFNCNDFAMAEAMVLGTGAAGIGWKDRCRPADNQGKSDENSKTGS